jgi:hypothetical protein
MQTHTSSVESQLTGLQGALSEKDQELAQMIRASQESVLISPKSSESTSGVSGSSEGPPQPPSGGGDDDEDAGVVFANNSSSNGGSGGAHRGRSALPSKKRSVAGPTDESMAAALTAQAAEHQTSLQQKDAALEIQRQETSALVAAKDKRIGLLERQLDTLAAQLNVDAKSVLSSEVLSRLAFARHASHACLP